jgi:hypothetical protein
VPAKYYPPDGTGPLNDQDGDGVADDVEIARGTDPLVKDKYLRFTFPQIYCDYAADDEGSPADCIEVDGTWYIRQGAVEEIVTQLDEEGFCQGATGYLSGKTYDFIILQGETVIAGTRNAAESDSDPANDDAFVDFLESFDYAWTGIGTRTPQISGTDGTLTTTIQVEEITGAPAVKYPPAGAGP